jgi:SNF2 family DNA or RNA helicase
VGGAVLGELVHRFKGLAEGKGHTKKSELMKFAEEADADKAEAPQLTIPGLKKGVQPYPHQKRAIEKMLHNDGTIVMAHGVGSGKTETSIMGQLVLKATGKSGSALVIVPAGLRRNYADRVKKRTTATAEVIGPKGEQGSVYVDAVKPGKDFYVISYELFRQHPELVERLRPGTLILDEYHKVRNPAGGTYEAIMSVRPAVPNFIGMTGSIVNNDPADIAPLISMATGNRFMNQKSFKRMFERRVARETGFFGGQKYIVGMQNLPRLQQEIGSLVDYVSSEDAAGDKMPRRKIEVVETPMSKEQEEYYRYSLNKLNPITAWQIRNNVSPSDQEMSTVFQQLMKARQVSNSLHTIDRRITPTQASYLTPKTYKLLEDTQEHLKNTPDGQVVIYSNLVHGGADVITAGLKARGIPFGVFLGKDREVEGVKSSDKVRTQAVQDYLAGKIRVIVISGAGAEGLDLKNTTMVQSLDGHFNPERILQAEARGRRIGGLEHRPPEQRQVVMKRYVSTIERDIWDKMFGKSETSVDQWVYGVAGRKAQINRQLLTALKGIPEKKTQPLETVLSTSTGKPPAKVVARPNPGIELPKKFDSRYIRRWRKPDGQIVYQYDNRQVV